MSLTKKVREGPWVRRRSGRETPGSAILADGRTDGGYTVRPSSVSHNPKFSPVESRVEQTGAHSTLLVSMFGEGRSQKNGLFTPTPLGEDP